MQSPRVRRKTCRTCKKTFRCSRDREKSGFPLRRSRSCGRLSWRYLARCKTCDWKFRATKRNRIATYAPCRKLPEPERTIRRLARHAVTNAVYYGTLKKPKHCSVCKKKTAQVDLHGHHEDYKKRLKVQWICRWCHMKTEGVFGKLQLRELRKGELLKGAM